MASNPTATHAADMGAIQAVPGRIVAAWAKNDADAFAAVFTKFGTMILPDDVFLTGRDKIAAYMKAAFEGQYKGTRVAGSPLSIRVLTPDVVLVLTRGGVLQPGETEVTPESAIRASWLLTKQDGEWLLAAYQNTPIGVPAASSAAA